MRSMLVKRDKMKKTSLLIFLLRKRHRMVRSKIDNKEVNFISIHT